MTTCLARMLRDFKRCWLSLFITDAVYKLLALVLLTPLAGVLFQSLLRWSGRPVLADQGLVFFLAAPLGWLCLISMGAVWLTIVALEMAALLAVLLAADDLNLLVRPRTALAYAASHAWPVLKITARMILRVLLLLLPFLLVALGVYLLLLNDYDINYYLKEKPPEFIGALVAGGVLLAVFAVIVLRLAANWFFALPLVLFEGVPVARALRTSTERGDGHRIRILMWLVLWGVFSLLVTSALTSLVILLGRWLVPMFEGVLPLMIIVIGLLLCLWFGVGLLANMISTTSFATMLMVLYREYGCDAELSTHSLLRKVEDQAPFVMQISRKYLVATLGVAAVVATLAGVVALNSVRLDDDVAIIAHRGASASAPENTLAAIEQAIEEGANWVEIDVQETADDVVVVMHDSDFMKLAGNTLKIWDATQEDLQEIDIGSWFSPEFSQQRVPTLRQVLELCKDKVKVDIELKYYGHDKQLEQRVIDIVESLGMADQVMYMSLKMAAVKKMKALRPDCKAGLLMSVSTGNLRQIEADFLAVNASFVDFWFVRAAHRLNKEVYVWTVNDPLLMSSMISQGVDGLITDQPATAVQVLDERASLGPAARVLLELADLFGVSPEAAPQ